MTMQDPAGWTAWDDLYAEFPTRRDAKIRALISKHQRAIEEQAAAEARRELLAKVRTTVEAAGYHRDYRAALLDIKALIEESSRG